MFASRQPVLGPAGRAELRQRRPLLPTNQWISPLGTRLFQDNARIITSSISPNGQYLAALTWNDYDTTLTIVDLTTGASKASSIFNGFELPAGAADRFANEDGTVSTDPPVWSSDGTTIWVAQTDYMDRFSFDPSTMATTQTADIWLCGQGSTSPSAAGPGCDSYGPGVADGAYIPSGHGALRRRQQALCRFQRL